MLPVNFSETLENNQGNIVAQDIPRFEQLHSESCGSNVNVNLRHVEANDPGDEGNYSWSLSSSIDQECVLDNQHQDILRTDSCKSFEPPISESSHSSRELHRRIKLINQECSWSTDASGSSDNFALNDTDRCNSSCLSHLTGSVSSSIDQKCVHFDSKPTLARSQSFHLSQKLRCQFCYYHTTSADNLSTLAQYSDNSTSNSDAAAKPLHLNSTYPKHSTTTMESTTQFNREFNCQLHPYHNSHWSTRRKRPTENTNEEAFIVFDKVSSTKDLSSKKLQQSTHGSSVSNLHPEVPTNSNVANISRTSASATSTEVHPPTTPQESLEGSGSDLRHQVSSFKIRNDVLHGYFWVSVYNVINMIRDQFLCPDTDTESSSVTSSEQLAAMKKINKEYDRDNE